MRLRFTIRDLLLITVIVALVVGWWIDHRRLSKDEWLLVETFRAKGHVGFSSDR